MDNRRLVAKSKFLSWHLRHHPENLGLALQPGGWVGVDELLAACNSQGLDFTREDLDEVVAQDDKHRFSFDDSCSHVRANHGQTVAVDMQLESATPPAILYHGTPQRSVATILQEGLRKMERTHVHMSPDIETAVKVGSRRGKPVVFEIDAEAMARDGVVFHYTVSGIWFTEYVDPRYLRVRT